MSTTLIHFRLISEISFLNFEPDEQQGPVLTQVKLPETIKRKPKKERLYSQIQQMPLVYEEDRPQFYEESHVISTIQQGQIRTEVSLPDIKRVKPLTPIKPKERVTYTAEKTLAAQYISKTLQPYIEIEKIEQPKSYETVISTLQQGQVLTKVSLPERAQPLVPVKPKEHITYTAEKTLAAEYISKTLHPYIEIEKIEQTKPESCKCNPFVDDIFKIDILFLFLDEKQVLQPLKKTDAFRPQIYDETFSTVCLQGQIRTEVQLPDTKRVKPLTPIKPKEQVTYTAEKTLAAEYISKTLQPYIEVEKIEQPKQFDEVISTIQQQQVLTQVRLPTERIETTCEYNFVSLRA